MAGLVVKEWNVSQQPDAAGNFVHISARAPGITSSILSMMGLDSTATLRVSGDTIVFEEASMSGNITRHIPLDKVTSVTHGYAKPLKESIYMGIVLGLLTVGIGAVLAVVYYLLMKTVTIGVSGSGGIDTALDLKASGSGGVTPEQAAQVGQLIYELKKRSR